MANETNSGVITLHCYAPPIRKCQYVDPCNGMMKKCEMKYDTEYGTCSPYVLCPKFYKFKSNESENENSMEKIEYNCLF